MNRKKKLIKPIKIFKKPTSSVMYQFNKLETEKTKPNPKNRAKPEKTKPNRNQTHWKLQKKTQKTI
jgi:hypothetical protein